MKRLGIVILTIISLLSFTWAQAIHYEDLMNEAREAIKSGDLPAADDAYKRAMSHETADEDDYEIIKKEWEILEGINIKLADGRRSFDRADWAEALKKYEEAVAAMDAAGTENWAKTKAEAFYSMGMVHFREERPTKAADEFREAQMLEPLQEKYGKAIQMVRNKHYSEGHSLYKRRDYSGARAQYMIAVEVDPTFSSAYYMIGVIDKKDGNLTSAEQNYKLAVQYDPTHHKSWYSLGLLYSDRGDNNRAIEAFKRAIEIDPNYDKALYSLAKVYEGQSKTSEAVAHLKEAIAANKKYTRAYELLSKIYVEAEQFNETIALLINVTGPAASQKTYYHLAQAHNETGDCTAALAAANKALVKKKNYSPAMFEKGNALACLGNTQEAVAVFTEVSKDPRWKSPAQYRISELTKWQGK